MIKTCEICGSEFETKTPRARFCSWDCRDYGTSVQYLYKKRFKQQDAEWLNKYKSILDKYGD